MNTTMKRRLSGRTAVLVDIENILGTTDFDESDVAAARRGIVMAGEVAADAHVTVATSAGASLVQVHSGWPGARLRFRRGCDGADLALAEVALNENLVGRFDRVVIASGDGMFAVVAAWLVEHGVEVTVVARPESLSRALSRRATRVSVLVAQDSFGMSA